MTSLQQKKNDDISLKNTSIIN